MLGIRLHPGAKTRGQDQCFHNFGTNSGIDGSFCSSGFFPALQTLQGLFDGGGIKFDFFRVVSAFYSMADKKINGILVVDLGQGFFTPDFPAFIHAIAPIADFFKTVLGGYAAFRMAHEIIQHDPAGLKVGFQKKGK
jgi:hypothetical protein